MLRLKANKTSLYNLVATYKPLPGMRRVDFQKANGRPDYWLEWTTDDGHTKAFLSSSLGHPILTITTHDAAGGQLYHEAHRLSVEGLRGARHGGGSHHRHGEEAAGTWQSVTT